MEDVSMNKMRVWWIPQIGASNEAFYIPVQNRIKPDYCNTGGLEIYNAETEEYEDWYFETEDEYFEDVDEYLSTTDKAEEIDNFTSELFKQIDWEKIERMTH